MLDKYYFYDNLKKHLENNFYSKQLFMRTNKDVFNLARNFVKYKDRATNEEFYNHVLNQLKDKPLEETNTRVRKEINFRSTKTLNEFIERIDEWKKIKDNKEKKLLDVGAGKGDKTLLTRKFFNIPLDNTYCLELEKNNKKEQIKEACKFKFYKGDKFPFDKDEFDVVTVFLVIHNVYNVKEFFKEVKRVIKKDGFLIIREHDINQEEERANLHLLHFLYNLKDRLSYDESMFGTFRSSKEIIKLVEDNKFKFIKLSNASGFTRARYLIFQSK